MYVHELTLEYTVDGDLATFDSNAAASAIAAEIGVAASSVETTVTAASVRVVHVISYQDVASAMTRSPADGKTAAQLEHDRGHRRHGTARSAIASACSVRPSAPKAAALAPPLSAPSPSLLPPPSAFICPNFRRLVVCADSDASGRA